jgi:hypothetical protein
VTDVKDVTDVHVTFIDPDRAACKLYQCCWYDGCKVLLSISSSIVTFSIVTFSIVTFSIVTSFVVPSSIVAAIVALRVWAGTEPEAALIFILF